MRRCLDCPTLIRSGSRCARCDKARRQKGFGRNGWTWTATRQRIIARDGGCTMPPPHDGPLEVHHIVRREHGGTNADDNLVTLCRRHHQQQGEGA